MPRSVSSLASDGVETDRLRRGTAAVLKALSADPSRFHISRYQNQEYLSTGIPEVDRLLNGGIPRGKLVEITGSLSSGKTSFLISLLAQATRQEEFVAYVDSFDCLAPECLEQMGVDLSGLLWIRCRKEGDSGAVAVENALQALDILLQAGGFGLVVLDLQPFGPIRGWKVPLHCWFRLQRFAKGTPTAVVVLSRYRAVGSAASLVLNLERGPSRWTHRSSRTSLLNYDVSPAAGSRLANPVSGVNRLQGLEVNVRLFRGEKHGSIPIFCDF